MTLFDPRNDPPPGQTPRLSPDPLSDTSPPPSTTSTACIVRTDPYTVTRTNDHRRPPITDGMTSTTGTEAGYRRHRRAGEPPCPPCAEAAAYWKRQRRTRAARRAAFLATWADRAEAFADLADELDIDYEALWGFVGPAVTIARPMTGVPELPPALPNPDDMPTPEATRLAQLSPGPDDTIMVTPWQSIEQSLWAQARATRPGTDPERAAPPPPS